MRIAIGSDHRGLALKEEVMRELVKWGHTPLDCGAYDSQRVDYPDIAQVVCGKVLSGEYDLGILICGTGIGMSIAANKVKGVRAALCCDVFMAERARLHNDANILCLGAERTPKAAEIVHAFLETRFEGGRHQKRLEKIAGIENI